MPRSGTRPPGHPADLCREVTREVPDDTAQELCPGPGDGPTLYFRGCESLLPCPHLSFCSQRCLCHGDTVWILGCFLNPSSSQSFHIRNLSSTFATWPLLHLKDSYLQVSSTCTEVPSSGFQTILFRPTRGICFWYETHWVAVLRVHTEN